jgi:steroid 5-alpha reductase family enzyme
VTQWWGIWLFALDLPFGWATILSPLGVTYLILQISGVTMLEDVMKSRPGFREYASKTSKFIPMPPRFT